MKCETCKGTGYVKIKDLGLQYFISMGMYYGRLPCPDCNGTGHVHCCDGEIVNEKRPFKQFSDTQEPPRKTVSGKPHESL